MLIKLSTLSYTLTFINDQLFCDVEVRVKTVEIKPDVRWLKWTFVVASLFYRWLPCSVFYCMQAATKTIASMNTFPTSMKVLLAVF